MMRERHSGAFQKSWIWIVLLVPLVLPSSLVAQSVLTIAPQQCVWRSGDDLRWAAPSLDETGWRPYTEWHPQSGRQQLWMRCHVDLAALRDTAQPAIQVSLYAAYELYGNGSLLGRSGNLGNGNFSLNSIRSYPVEHNLLASGPLILALRIHRHDPVTISTPTLSLLASTLELRVGDATMLDALRARVVLQRSSKYLEVALCYGVIAVIAIMLLGLFFYDRDRRELLLLSITCLGLAALRWNEFATASYWNRSFTAALSVITAANYALIPTHQPFFFALARRKMPWIFWGLLFAASLAYLPGAIDIVSTARQPAWLGALNDELDRPLALAAQFALSFAPFVAFWPYGRLAHRLRPLAALCMAWGIADLVWFAMQATALHLPGVPDLASRWHEAVLDVRAFFTASVLAAILGLLFREQRQITRERALLAGEMQAASGIQRMLAAAALETAPGFQIDVAFHPMRDVGGDFYLCRVLPDGRQRVLFGDVSGKGTAAAMTAALLLGGAAARDQDTPAGLLVHLNRVLRENRLSGFATCLCADLAPEGTVAIANAGHLAPYCQGKEIDVPSGLPLGVDTRTESANDEVTFRLGPGEALTFLSDGVVEARNETGELFGFERTRSISASPADEIASAARQFGQDDDITVLTLTRLGKSEKPSTRISTQRFVQA